MNPATLSALAALGGSALGGSALGGSALGGSALGGITPLISNYLIQRGLTKREMLSRELADRQTVYADFIQFATKVYVDDLVALYALVSRIRLFASEPVIGAAEQFAARVTKRYGEATLSMEDLRSETLSPHVDPLHNFSSLCRQEMRAFLSKGLY